MAIEYIALAVENVFEPKPLDLCGFVDWTPSGNLGFCWDPAHSYVYSPTPVSEWLRPLAPRLKVMHLSDNLGDWDSHRPLGNGAVPLKDICEAVFELELDVPWVLELNRGEALESIEYLKHNGFERWFELP